MRRVFQSLLIAAVIVGLACVGRSVSAQEATAVVPEGCDATFHDVMRSRAWMEAQREIEVSQAIITKPASVFDLTCYSNQLAQAKSIGIFALNLPGRIDSVVQTTGMVCDNMKNVSYQLRCGNADKNKLFPTFDKLMKGDVRPSCQPDQDWKKAIPIVYPDDLPRKPEKAGPDEFKSYLDVTDPAKCEGSAYILPGIEYSYFNRQGQRQTKAAGTCLSVGCVFDGNKCVASVRP